MESFIQKLQEIKRPKYWRKNTVRVCGQSSNKTFSLSAWESDLVNFLGLFPRNLIASAMLLGNTAIVKTITEKVACRPEGTINEPWLPDADTVALGSIECRDSYN